MQEAPTFPWLTCYFFLSLDLSLPIVEALGVKFLPFYLPVPWLHQYVNDMAKRMHEQVPGVRPLISTTYSVGSHNSFETEVRFENRDMHINLTTQFISEGPSEGPIQWLARVTYVMQRRRSVIEHFARTDAGFWYNVDGIVFALPRPLTSLPPRSTMIPHNFNRTPLTNPQAMLRHVFDNAVKQCLKEV
jgi:hypothetical protein